MGFQGTFKGTLKENFDRMMNPRKFLNEMDQFGNTQLSQMGIEQDTKKLQQDNGSRNLPPNQGKKITVNMKTSDIIRYATEFFKWRGVVDLKKVSALGSSDYDRFIEYLYSKPENIKESTEEVDETINTDNNNSNDIVGKIMRWEEGEMTDDETIDFFSELITTGQINGLQGVYGRTAQSLIDAGYLDRSGKVLMHTGGEMDESNINSVTEEVVMPNLVENYNRLQILNKKLSKKNLNEVGFDQNGNPMGFDNSEEGYGDDPIDSRPKKGDAVYLQTGYQDVASRIMYIDATHIYWKTDSVNTIETGSKGGVYHIGQLRNKQLYNDLLTWMNTGDKTALETTKYKDI